MVSMCLRHFTHPLTGRMGWYCGIEFSDPKIDNVDVEADADLIERMIAEHQPDVIDIREHGDNEAADFDRVLGLATDRKRLRSIVRHTDPVWRMKYEITEEEN